MLQISEIHAIFDNDSKTAVKVRIFVTNLGLKTTEFFINIFYRDYQDFHQKSTVHPQQTTQVNMEFKCRTNNCNAVGECFLKKKKKKKLEVLNVVW